MPVVQDEISLVKVANGDDGRGILGTPVATYAQSTSGTIPPTSWSATRPNVPAGQYLWTRVVTTYTDNTTSETQTPTLMGAEGESGLGIKDKSISYAVGTSGNTPPTSGWQETIPTVSANQYLWTKTTLIYTDESKTEAYSVGKMGANGADAKLLYLTASAENMAFNADDTPKTTQTINISAKLQNVIGTATFTAIPYIGNTAQTAITLGGTGNTRTLTSAQWTNKNWTLIAITATLDNLSDTLSIVKVKDGATGDKGDKGDQGDRGLMGIAYVQQTQPSDTTEGAQWFKTDATDKQIIASYVFKNGTWQEKKYASGTLAVESLDALSANLGEMTAGIINGVEIQGAGLYSEYDYQIVAGGTVWRRGRLSMSGGYFRNDFETYVKSTGEIQNNGFSQFSHEDMQFVVFSGSQTTKADRTLSINPYSFTMTDSRGFGGNLTFQDLYNIGKTGIPAASGWEQYNTSASSGHFPSARRLGRVVQLAGAFKNNALKAAGTENEVMGILPVGFRPESNCNFVVQGTGHNIYLLSVQADGKLIFGRYRGDTGGKYDYKDCGAGSWLNIACTYAAADV